MKNKYAICYMYFQYPSLYGEIWGFTKQGVNNRKCRNKNWQHLQHIYIVSNVMRILTWARSIRIDTTKRIHNDRDGCHCCIISPKLNNIERPILIYSITIFDKTVQFRLCSRIIKKMFGFITISTLFPHVSPSTLFKEKSVFYRLHRRMHPIVWERNRSFTKISLRNCASHEFNIFGCCHRNC